VPSQHSAFESFDLSRLVNCPIEQAPAALAALAGAVTALSARLLQITPAIEPDTGLIDAPALAAKLNLNESWIRSRQRAGRIPHVKCGRFVRFRISDVTAALEAKP
jgi:predicted DNA-binding transcriptional regulator AlpA